VRQACIGQFIACAPPFRRGNHEPTATQTRQVIGQILPARAQRLGQLGRISRPSTQGQQQPSPYRIGQGMAETGEHLPVRQRLHAEIVQLELNKQDAELSGGDVTDERVPACPAVNSRLIGPGAAPESR
jgi:hypothetical protein